MILSQVVNLGEMLRIEAEELVARTKLQDIIDDHNFIVFQPTVHGIPLRSSKKPMRFSFFRNNGLYEFDAVMEKSYIVDELRVCQFKTVSEVEKRQRRSSYRLPIILDALVGLIQPEIDIPGSHAVFEVKTSDLSDTGLQFYSFEYFPSGTLIQINIKLDTEMCLYAKVIRSYLPTKKTAKYSTSVQFINLMSKDQAQISRFVLKTQIKKRNRAR